MGTAYTTSPPICYLLASVIGEFAGAIPSPSGVLPALPACMVAHFHFSRPHRATLRDQWPRRQDRDPRPTPPPGTTTSPSIERPRTAQPRHDHITSGSDLSGLHRSIHAGCPYPRNVQRGRYTDIPTRASGAGRFSAICLRTANYLRKTSCVKSKYRFQDMQVSRHQGSRLEKTRKTTPCVKMAILPELNTPNPHT